MLYSNFIKSNKITSKISETVIPGNHIMVEGERFEKLSRKPYGRSIIRTLKSIDEKETITCYG